MSVRKGARGIDLPGRVRVGCRTSVQAGVERERESAFISEDPISASNRKAGRTIPRPEVASSARHPTSPA